MMFILLKWEKIYAWDDITKTEEIEYDDEKLNDLEKTRRENIDKIKLMNQEFNNKYSNLYANDDIDRKDKVTKRMLQKLYDKGKISTKEFELMQEETKPNVKNKINEDDQKKKK